MQKRIRPADRAAKPEQVVTIEARRIVHEAANDPASGRGALNYLGKPAKNARTEAVKRVEREVIGHGQYVGSNGQVTAFVWLDDEVPAAANDAE